jgi:hypothetical protein
LAEGFCKAPNLRGSRKSEERSLNESSNETQSLTLFLNLCNPVSSAIANIFNIRTELQKK